MVEQVKTKSEPYVRFRGFTDEWEEVKLGDVAPLRGGFAFKSDMFINDGVPIVRISNIISDGSINGPFAYYGEQDTDDNYILPDKAAVLAMSGATTGKVSILKNPDNDKFYQNQRVGYFKPTDKVNYNFLSTIVRSNMFTNQLRTVLVAGAQPNISSKDVDGFLFRIPTDTDEQQVIGELFQTLDSAIDLSNTQVENLKQQKKALLQRLFPQKGETEPKVRLRGFTEEWDSSLLLDEIEVYQPKSLPQSKFLDEGYPVYGANGMIGYYDEYNHENRQIAMACRGNTAGVVNIIPEQSYITGNAMIMDVYTNNKLDFNFMGQLFNNFDFTPYISGSGQPQITRSALKGVYIRIPSLPEQQAIGELFQTLDEQIRLAEDKVSQYKELKQALLQRLFV